MATATLTLGSQNRWLADGSTTIWNFNFVGGYLASDTVLAYSFLTDEAVRIDHTLEFISAFQVRITPAVADGRTLVIYRDSSNGGLPRADFTDGGGITESNLDLMAKQSVFVSEEVRDFIGITTEADLASALLATSNNAAASAASAASAAVSADQAEVANAASAINVSLAEGYKTAAELAAANAAVPAAALAAKLVGTGSGQGGVNVGLRDTAGNWNATDLEVLATEVADTSAYVNLFRFFTDAQRADYIARTAQLNYAAALDLSSAIQTAIYTTYAAGRNLYCPAGSAKIVTGLEAPTNTASYEDRGDAWHMLGQGAAQTFVRQSKGTVFVTSTDTPILRYHQRRGMPTAGGNTRVNHIRFEQRNVAAASPVVLWDSMSEYADFSWNQIIQFGTGNGLEVTYHIKGNITHNFVMCGDYFTGGKSAAGIAFNIPSAADSGLLTIKKNSARNFHWGYVIGDGVNDPSGTRVEQNEVSFCTNGFWIKPLVTSCTLDNNFTEGITGTCVRDDGICTKIRGGMHYTGFSIGIDASNVTSNYGTVIEGNYLETAGVIPCTLIKVNSGGPTKTVRENHLLFSASGGVVPGVVGLDIAGSPARINHHSNAFNPRGRWVGGAGTIKINDTTTAGAYGLGTANDVDQEVPALRRGAMSLALGAVVLTNSDLVGNKLTVGDLSFYQVNGTAATINEISFVNTRHGQRILFETTTGNLMVFTNSALMKLAGAATFTGPGTIEFVCTVSGSTVTAKEVGRTVF